MNSTSAPALLSAKGKHKQTCAAPEVFGDSAAPPTDDQQDGDGEEAEEQQEAEEPVAQGQEEEEEEDTCLICLSSIQDRTLLPICSHSLFCFDCILEWFRTGHGRCPLCSRDVGRYVIHEIRSEEDYLRFYLAGSSTSASKLDDNEAGTTWARSVREEQELRMTRGARRQLAMRHTRRDAKTGRRGGEDDNEEDDAMGRWNRQLETRRTVYREGLFSLHMGSNRISKLGAPPTPAQISQSNQLQSSLRHFLRREFLAICSVLHQGQQHDNDDNNNGGPLLDVNFLTTYTLSILQHLDVRSDETIRLLSELLSEGEDGIVGLLVHELYSFLRFCTGVGRGGGRRIWEWDREVKYGQGVWGRRNRERERGRERKRDRGDRSHRAETNADHPYPTNREEGARSKRKRPLRLGEDQTEESRREGSSEDHPTEADRGEDPGPSRERIRTQRSKLLDKLQIERTQQQQQISAVTKDRREDGDARRTRLMEKLRKERDTYKLDTVPSPAALAVQEEKGESINEQKEQELKRRILEARLRARGQQGSHTNNVK